MTMLAWVAVMGSAMATTWYVDSEGGSDLAVGTSAKTALRSLDAVNRLRTKLVPGDQVLFKRGGLWRGTLRPASGATGNPVVYSAYGEGPKPILQGSVDRTRPDDWVELSSGIWSTRIESPRVGGQIWNGICDGWHGSFQEGVKGSVRTVVENGEKMVRVTCTAQPKKARHLIQVWGPRFDNPASHSLMRLKVRSTKPFKLETGRLSMNHPPWAASHLGPFVDPRGDGVIGREWKTIELKLTEVAGVDASFFHFSIGDVMPGDCVFDFIPLGIWRIEVDPRAALAHDVGIFICDHGRAWGVKKWKPEDLRQPLDYWDDREHQRVLVRHDGNPARAYRSIELAYTKHIVEESGAHDVVYDGLAVRYGGAHGFGGGSTRAITIRNCDVYWIGGGLQFWRQDPQTGKAIHPVRYGNGIEFWGGCQGNLVEKNRLWQIYDAALTNQTKDSPAPEVDIVWRDNVIWQAEYSFEYWNHDPTSFTGNILFEHNTCVDAGGCWSHGQRPNPNGAHLMFYDNAAPTTNFVVRNNIFVRTTDRSTRMFNDWRAKLGEEVPSSTARVEGLVMHHNLYYIPEHKVYEYHVNGREKAQGKDIRREPVAFGAGPEEFAKYQREMQLDQHSVYGKPEFVDEAKRDYRLKPGSFGTNLATDGGPLGAR